MTRASLFIFFILWLSASTGAQQLTAEGNQWDIAVFPTFFPNTTSYSVQIKGDTLIDGRLYKKIRQSGDSLGLDWREMNQLIREDSLHRVYLISGNGEEELLYDFSLEIGDTFLIEGQCITEVVATDSITLNNGDKRKRWIFQNPDLPTWGTDEWIEGIGSREAVLAPSRVLCQTDYAVGLLCFFQNGALLYPEEPYSCFIVPVGELNTGGPISVFPNPFHDHLWVSGGQEPNGVACIRVYSPIGKFLRFA